MFISIVVPLVIFFAAFIRGCTGFGFSAIAILVLTLHYPVSETVPAVLMLDLLISLPLVAQSWARTDFQKLTPILWATLAGIPLGLFILWSLPNDALKILVPTTVLTLAVLPRLKWTWATTLLQSKVVAGVMSGWTTSAVSAGGAPVVIHLKHSDMPVNEQRDTLISYFFLTTCLTLGISYAMSKQFYWLPDNPIQQGIMAISGVLSGLFYHRRCSLQNKRSTYLHNIAYYLLLTLSMCSLLLAINAVLTTR